MANPHLTPQEYAALRAVAEAGSVKGAAVAMRISEQTAKNHLSAVYRKLGVSSYIGAARALGWLVVP